ncbi:hypothetical protein RB195_019079 [Necator americanus]
MPFLGAAERIKFHEILSLTILRLSPLREKPNRIFTCYSPTMKLMNPFYEKLEEVSSNEIFYKFNVGDFNEKLGKATKEKYRIGRFGLGDRNENGNSLSELLSAARFFHGNTLFIKKKIIVAGHGNRPMVRLVRRSTAYSPTGGGVYLTSQ